MDDDVRTLTFKIASEPWEFEQIHRLNYQTFVEEIPQHPANERGLLVDRFHERNAYMICLRGREVIAMLAMRCERPFSLDQKLGNIDHYLPPGDHKVAEIRLLATRRADRGGRVFFGLLSAGAQHLASAGYDLAVISGTTRQLKLYRHMGFVAFGPLIGTPGAMYQPMYVTRERFDRIASALHMPLPPDGKGRVISFLPGPVDVSEEVAAAMASRGRSHRSADFLRDFAATQRALCNLVNARHVQILSGSGTLANDVVAARLEMERSRGLILSNGEFGERLVDHARRRRLDFDVLRVPWGEALDHSDIAAAANDSIGWLWAVHCETSTGVLNDLAGLKNLCASRGIKLCLDCISSIGTMPTDLSGVHLATGVSGKGMRAFAGLCMVFHQDAIDLSADESLPRSMDLGYYATKEGVPFTVCSNLLDALRVAVGQIQLDQRASELREHHRRLRLGLSRLGLEVIAPESHAAAAVLTVALPADLPASSVGDELAEAGLLLSYRSDYLARRNWIQICLMGGHWASEIDRLLLELGRVTGKVESNDSQLARV